jgi:hypothetical protein
MIARVMSSPLHYKSGAYDLAVDGQKAQPQIASLQITSFDHRYPKSHLSGQMAMLSYDQFCMQGTCGIDTGQNVNHVTRRHAEGIQSCDNLGQGVPRRYFRQSGPRVFFDLRGCPWKNDRLAIGKGIWLNCDGLLLDAKRQVALAHRDAAYAHVGPHDDGA